MSVVSEAEGFLREPLETFVPNCSVEDCYLRGDRRVVFITPEMRFVVIPLCEDHQDVASVPTR